MKIIIKNNKRYIGIEYYFQNYRKGWTEMHLFSVSKWNKRCQSMRDYHRLTRWGKQLKDAFTACLPKGLYLHLSDNDLYSGPIKTKNIEICLTRASYYIDNRDIKKALHYIEMAKTINTF